jgi:hypothetical protein
MAVFISVITFAILITNMKCEQAQREDQKELENRLEE